MSPEAIEANRANAQKSTGPKTPEGKAKSRLNAGTHFGYATMASPVLPNESQEQYDQLRASYLSLFRPRNVLQQQLTDSFVAEMWSYMRMQRHEANACLFSPDPGIQNDELDKISRIKLRKWRHAQSLLKELRLTQRLAEGAQAELEWPHPHEMCLPGVEPEDLPLDAVIAPVGLEEEQDGGIPNKYYVRNPEVTSGKYDKLLDNMLGTMNTPNPTIRDIINRRAKGLPIGDIPDISGLLE